MEYVERLSHYFEANDITSEGKKRAILLNAVGPSTYIARESNRTLLRGESKCMHTSVRNPLLSSRGMIMCRGRGDHSSVRGRITQAAEYCQYSGVQDDMLHDRLVCGISHKGIQRSLLQDPALGEAMKVALSAEAADRAPRCWDSCR